MYKYLAKMIFRKMLLLATFAESECIWKLRLILQPTAMQAEFCMFNHYDTKPLAAERENERDREKKM